MEEFGYADEAIREVEKRSFYLPNPYSDKDMREKIEDAKKRVMEYIFVLTDQAGNDDILLTVLENYYLFWKVCLSVNHINAVGFKKASWILSE